MGDFKKMVVLPEQHFKELQEAKKDTNNISTDIFDKDVDYKVMEDLKNNLVKILNSDKVDKTTISAYKEDLTKLLDLESPQKNEIAPPHLNESEKNDKVNEDDNKDDTLRGDGMDYEDYSKSYGSDMDTEELDSRFVTTSESDFEENDFINDMSNSQENTSTPKSGEGEYLDETIRSGSPSKGANPRKVLFPSNEDTISFTQPALINVASLKGESKSTIRNAKNIQQYILQKGGGRIGSLAKDHFLIDGKKIPG